MNSTQPLSSWRAWGFFVAWSFRRHARARLLLVMVLALLALVSLLVLLTTHFNRWNMGAWRTQRTLPTFGEQLQWLDAASALPGNFSLVASVAGPIRTHMYSGSGLWIFSNWIVLGVFTSFLLPLLTMTFASEGLGRPREDRTLLWLLLRPLPRPALYLGQFLALLPWCLLVSLGGFCLLCLLGNGPGRIVLGIFCPAVLVGTVAFAALFHMFSACFRRSSILALAYAFLLETIAGNLPGQFKRLSLSFYVRCLMFEEGKPFGITPLRPALFQPVSGPVAFWVLTAATAIFLVIGTWVFSRKEYLDVS